MIGVGKGFNIGQVEGTQGVLIVHELGVQYFPSPRCRQHMLCHCSSLLTKHTNASIPLIARLGWEQGRGSVDQACTYFTKQKQMGPKVRFFWSVSHYFIKKMSCECINLIAQCKDRQTGRLEETVTRKDPLSMAFSLPLKYFESLFFWLTDSVSRWCATFVWNASSGFIQSIWHDINQKQRLLGDSREQEDILWTFTVHD